MLINHGNLKFTPHGEKGDSPLYEKIVAHVFISFSVSRSWLFDSKNPVNDLPSYVY